MFWFKSLLLLCFSHKKKWRRQLLRKKTWYFECIHHCVMGLFYGFSLTNLIALHGTTAALKRIKNEVNQEKFKIAKRTVDPNTPEYSSIVVLHDKTNKMRNPCACRTLSQHKWLYEIVLMHIWFPYVSHFLLEYTLYVCKNGLLIKRFQFTTRIGNVYICLACFMAAQLNDAHSVDRTMYDELASVCEFIFSTNIICYYIVNDFYWFRSHYPNWILKASSEKAIGRLYSSINCINLS